MARPYELYNSFYANYKDVVLHVMMESILSKGKIEKYMKVKSDWRKSKNMLLLIYKALKREEW